MTTKSYASRVALIVILSCLIVAGLTSAVAQDKSDQANLSVQEKVLVMAIMAAPDPAPKLKAVGDLIKKYPKTAVRRRYAGIMADQIAAVTEPARKITLAQEYQKIFTEPSEQDLIVAIMIDAYADSDRPDDAFMAGATLLGRQGDSVRTLGRLTQLGTAQARKHNGKFVPDSLKYGANAIDLITADKKPADLDDAAWSDYKKVTLPGLYQSLGLLQFVTGDHGGAKVRFVKAIELAPSDAYDYLMLAALLNEEYQNAAKVYQSMPESQAKRDTLPKTLAMLDGVIDAYAHMIALSEGNAAMQPARQQYLQDIEGYYKYRHNNSTAGMQELIDKYKAAPKP